MKHTALIVLCIFSVFVAGYMLYRYVETSRIAKLMEKKKSLYTSEKSKVKNHSFFLVSSFLIFCLSAGAALKTINSDKKAVNESARSSSSDNQLSAAYSLGQDPVMYDAVPKMASDEMESLENGGEECKTMRESDSDAQLLSAVNSLLSQTEKVQFEAMNTVDLVTYTFDQEAIANCLVNGQELNIYQEGDEYFVEVRQIYRLEEANESSDGSE